MVSGGATHATWPLNEDNCRTMLLLHWPNWFDIQEVKGDVESRIDRFRDFETTSDCPTFVKAQVPKTQRYADHPQELVFEEDDGDDAVEESHGGDDYDWSSNCIILPEGKDPKKWLQDSIKENEEQETKTVDLELPPVSPLSLNENRRAIVSLVLYTLFNFVENPQDYHPL